MPKILQKSVTLLPKQLEFLSSTQKEVLASGGFGSSKSTILCYACIKQACIPNNVVLLVRKTLVSLKKTTLLTLLNGENPILPPNSYKHNKSEGVIELNGGGTILYSGLDDVAKIRSMNLGGIFLDEGSELSEEEYQELYYRLRLKHGSRQLFCATNPATQSHPMYKRFFLTKNSNRKVITMSSLENIFLPPDYIQSLKDIEAEDSIRYRKFVLGEWCQMENAVYSNFDRKIHVKRIEPLKWDEIIIGVDAGYRDPFVILICGIIGNRIYILEEIYKRKQLLSDIEESFSYIRNKYDTPIVIYDPSAALIGAEISNMGFKTIKADNDIKIGLNRVRSKLSVRYDSPDIIVDDNCLNVITEFENYAYDKDTEKPKDCNNHAMDALRYIVNYIDNKRIDPKSQSPIIYFGEEEADDDF